MIHSTFLLVGPSSRMGENVTRDDFLDNEEFELLLEIVEITLLFFLGVSIDESVCWIGEEVDSIDTTHVLGFLLKDTLSDEDWPVVDDIDAGKADDIEDPLSILLNRFWWNDSVGV